MKKIIRLTELDLARIVKRVINENKRPLREGLRNSMSVKKSLSDPNTKKVSFSYRELGIKYPDDLTSSAPSGFVVKKNGKVQLWHDSKGWDVFNIFGNLTSGELTATVTTPPSKLTNFLNTNKNVEWSYSYPKVTFVSVPDPVGDEDDFDISDLYV